MNYLKKLKIYLVTRYENNDKMWEASSEENMQTDRFGYMKTFVR